MLHLADGDEAEASKAALRALAVAGGPAEVPELLRAAARFPDEERRMLAARAVAAVAGRMPDPLQATAPVVAAIREADRPEDKAALLLSLSVIVRNAGPSDSALELARSALSDGDERVRTAALRVLADWPNGRAVTTLLDVLAAPASTAVQKETALRAAVRMAEQAATGRDSSLDPLPLLTRLIEFARTKDEKVVVIGGLRTLKRPEAFTMLEKYIGQPEVHIEAALAALQLAPSLSNSSAGEQVREAVQRLSQDADPAVREKAVQVANRAARRKR